MTEEQASKSEPRKVPYVKPPVMIMSKVKLSLSFTSTSSDFQQKNQIFWCPPLWFLLCQPNESLSSSKKPQ